MTVTPPLVKPAYDGTPRFVLAATGQQIRLLGGNVIDGASDAVGQTAPTTSGANTVRRVINPEDIETAAPSGSGTNFASYVHTLNAQALAAIDADCAAYAAASMYIQLDFHQASWKSYFGGKGIWPWYYTDNRFAGGKYKKGSGSADKSGAIKNWWISEAAMSGALYAGCWKAFLTWAQTKTWWPWVWSLQPFNEPNAGGMSGTDASKTATIHGWIADLLTAIDPVAHAVGKGVMCLGGGQAYGTATYAELGDPSSTNWFVEYHEYYTGQEPGFPAKTAPDVGYNAAGDEYFPNSNACHNTPSGSKYTGKQDALDAFVSVAINKAKTLGVPIYIGETNARYDDPGRLTFTSQMQKVLDKYLLSCTVWKFGVPPGDSLGICNSDGSLNDIGQAWSTYWKATPKIIGSGTPPPSFTVQPAIDQTKPVVGTVITCDGGKVTGTPTPSEAFKWESSSDGGSSWTPISGATAANYTVASSDLGNVLRCECTATNTGGVAVADTVATAAVKNPSGTAPVCTTPPALTPSTAAVPGTTITCDGGTWTGTPVLSYQWLRRSIAGVSSDIQGATAPTYTPVLADGEYEVACRVSEARGGVSTSALTALPADLAIIINPAITLVSSPVSGDTLVCDPGSYNRVPDSLQFQWQASTDGGTTWNDLPGQTGESLVVA